MSSRVDRTIGNFIYTMSPTPQFGHCFTAPAKRGAEGENAVDIGWCFYF